jgi:hypothetical protein
MSAVANREEQLDPAVPAPEPVSILAVIERAARDPQVDADKMERMMALYERVNAATAKAAYTKALAEMQEDLPVIGQRGAIKNRDKEVQSRYSLWEDINETIKPVLMKHGFALSFRTGQEGDRITVTGVLSHREGHSEQTTMFLPADTSGSKNPVQAVGSSVSYGKRYTASALLNLTSSGEDDDGRTGGGDGPISPDQLQHVRDQIERTESNIEAFCKYYKIDALPSLRAKDFDSAMRMLNAKSRKKQ